MFLRGSLYIQFYAHRSPQIDLWGTLSTQSCRSFAQSALRDTPRIAPRRSSQSRKRSGLADRRPCNSHQRLPLLIRTDLVRNDRIARTSRCRSCPACMSAGACSTRRSTLTWRCNRMLRRRTLTSNHRGCARRRWCSSRGGLRSGHVQRKSLNSNPRDDTYLRLPCLEI